MDDSKQLLEYLKPTLNGLGNCSPIETEMLPMLIQAIRLVARLTPKKQGDAQSFVEETLGSPPIDGHSVLSVLGKLLRILDIVNAPVPRGRKRIARLRDTLGVKMPRNSPRGRRSDRSLEDDLELLDDFDAEKKRQHAEGSVTRSIDKIGTIWAKYWLRDAYERQMGPQGRTAQLRQIIKTRARLIGADYAKDIKRARARINTRNRRLSHRARQI